MRVRLFDPSAVITAMVLAIGAATGAVAATDPASLLPPEGAQLPTTALLSPRLEAAPTNPNKGPRAPTATRSPSITLRSLAADFARTGAADRKRLAGRTIVVCQREGGPWRDRLARYLETMFGEDAPITVVDAADISRHPAFATLVAFSEGEAPDPHCLARHPGFDAFMERTLGKARAAGPAGACPAALAVSGQRVRWYVADMTGADPSCTAARFGEILGLPHWARDPARRPADLPVIRAYLNLLYGSEDPRATAPTAPWGRH